MANCVNCGAPMRLDKTIGARVCTHCGSTEEQPVIVEGLEVAADSETSCPVCSTPLADANLDGTPLLVCQRCQGMLIAMRDFVAVVDAATAREETHGVVLPRRQKPGDRAIACPSCTQPMMSHLYGGPGNLVIDSCERCQINWLDSGELRRIARAM